jgi:hypothetical protein
VFPRYYAQEIAAGAYLYQPIPVNANVSIDVECSGTPTSQCEVLFVKNPRYFELWQRGTNTTDFYFTPPTKHNVRCQYIVENWKVPSYEGSRISYFIVKNKKTDQVVRAVYNIRALQP